MLSSNESNHSKHSSTNSIDDIKNKIKAFKTGRKDKENSENSSNFNFEVSREALSKYRKSKTDDSSEEANTARSSSVTLNTRSETSKAEIKDVEKQINNYLTNNVQGQNSATYTIKVKGTPERDYDSVNSNTVININSNSHNSNTVINRLTLNVLNSNVKEKDKTPSNSQNSTIGLNRGLKSNSANNFLTDNKKRESVNIDSAGSRSGKDTQMSSNSMMNLLKDFKKLKESR